MSYQCDLSSRYDLLHRVTSSQNMMLCHIRCDKTLDLAGPDPYFKINFIGFREIIGMYYKLE